MSDQDLLTTIKFAVDGSGVGAGLTSVKRSIKDLGDAVKSITETTNNTLAKVGTTELPVAKGLTKATKDVIKQTGEISKAIETFGSTASTSLKSAYKSIEAEEIRLRGMGIDASVMNPYLEKLKEVQKITAAVASQERTLAQEVAKGAAEENRRLEHTLELKRQLANVKTTVEGSAAKAQAEAVAQQQMKLLDLNNKIQASNKATAAAQAQAAEKTARDLKDQTAAVAAFRVEVQNAELNLVHFGRAKTAAFLQDKGARLGFDPAIVQAELAGLAKIEAANKAAFAAANPHIAELSKRAADAGTSVKGLSASLRNVPAQFTDIIVSLQGGQAPLTVLLQQGGQLKDMFGGIGNAGRALGGYIMGLVNPFTIVAATVGTLGLAYLKGKAESEAFTKALILSGNSAGTTANQLAGMAQNVSKATGGTVGAAAEALAALAGNGNIAAAQFEKIAAAAIGMEKTTGVAVAETVKQFAELGKDPLQASLKLNESTHFLTLSVYEQIKALMEQGRTLEAGAIAQNAFADVMKTRTPALLENLGLVEKAWRGITGAAKGAWDAVAGVGRDTTLEDQIAAIKNKLADKHTRSNLWDGGKALDKELETLQRMAASQSQAAAFQARQAKATEAQIVFDKEHDKYLSKAVQMQRELAVAGNKFAGVMPTADNVASYVATIKGIQEKFKESAGAKGPKASKPPMGAWDKSVISEYAKAMDKIHDVQLKAAASAENLSKSQEALRAVQASPQWESFNRQMKEQIIYSAALAQAKEDEAAATNTLAAAQKAIEKARDSAIQSHAKELESINDKAQKLEDEVAMYGLSKAAIEQLTEARMLDQIEVLKGFDNSAEEIARIRETIAARKRLAAAGTALDAKEDAAKAAKHAADEWQKTADQIEQSLTDALMRGFESGKGFLRNMRDTAVNMFNTMVLRPTISAGVMGMTGMSGAANAGQSGLSSMASIGNPFTNFAGSIGNGLADFGTTLVDKGFTQIGTGLESLGLQINGASSSINMLGDAVGYASAIYAASQGKWGQAAGAAIGTYFGGPIGSAIGSAIGKMVDEAFAGETRIGADYSANTTTGALSKDYMVSGGELQGEAVRSGIAETVAGINMRLGLLGSSTALTGFRAGLSTSDRDRGGVFSGGTLSNGQIFGEAGTGDMYKQQKFETTSTMSPDAKTALENFVADLNQVSIQALQAAADVPKTIADMIAGVDAEALSKDAAAKLLANIDAVITAVSGFNLVIKSLPFEYLKNLSFDIAAGLIKAAGGLDALGASLSSYYDNFYSADEKTANLTANTAKAFEALGLVMPEMNDAARAWYRSEVERLGAMDLSIAANATAYASILSLNGAVNQLAPTFADTAQAANDAAQAIAKAVEKMQAATENANSVAVQLGLTTSYELAQSAALTAWDTFKAAMPQAAGYTSAEVVNFARDPDQMGQLGEKDQAIINNFVDAIGQWETAKSNAASSSTDTSYTPDTSIEDAIAAITKGLTDAGAALGIELLKAQGKTAEAVAAQRAIDTADYDAAQVALYDYNQTLRDQITALTEAAAKQADIASERAGLQDQYDQLTMTNIELLAKQRDALDESNRALFDSINAINAEATAKDATLAATSSAANDAYDALQRAVDAQRDSQQMALDVASEQVSALESVFDVLKTNIDDLYGSVSSTSAIQAAQGSAFITQALATARTTGYLPDSQDLSDAISQARAGMDATAYTSQADADFARMVMAGELSELGVISGDQLTSAEKALALAEAELTSLDAILSTAQQQLDATNGINTSVLSVAAALAAFGASLTSLMHERIEQDLPTGAGGFSGMSSAPGSYDTASLDGANGAWVRSLYDEFADKSASEIDAQGYAYWVDQANTIGLVETAKRFEASARSVLGYAVGTNYVPEDGLAYLHQGEAVVPKAYNPAAGGSSSNNNARLESLVEGLTKEVQRLQSIAQDGNRSNERIATAVNGNPDMPILVQTV